MHRTNWEFRKFYEILCELEEVEVAAVYGGGGGYYGGKGSKHNDVL